MHNLPTTYACCLVLLPKWFRWPLNHYDLFIAVAVLGQAMNAARACPNAVFHGTVLERIRVWPGLN
jgi:hypothetical protein